MTIAFDLGDIPTKAAEKKIEDNPYFAMINTIKDAKKSAKFTVPTEKDDTYKKATTRVRTLLNDMSEHIGRTIRCTFTPEKDVTNVNSIRAEVWVMDRKIVRKKKEETPATETPAAEETPAETPEETPEETPAETPAEETPAETPADAQENTPEETPADNKGRRNRRNAA